MLVLYNPVHVEGHTLGWMTFDKTGEIAEINDDLRHYWESTSVLTNKEGASILLYCGYNEESYVLYAYSDGKVKKLIDTPHSLDFWLYERNSETYLVAYTDQAVYSINASDVNIDTIEDVFSPIEMSENVRGAIPYSNNDILYIVPRWADMDMDFISDKKIIRQGEVDNKGFNIQFMVMTIESN